MFLNDRLLIGPSLVLIFVFFSILFFYLVCKCHCIFSCIGLFIHVCCLNFNKLSVSVFLPLICFMFLFYYYISFFIFWCMCSTKLAKRKLWNVHYFKYPAVVSYVARHACSLNSSWTSSINQRTAQNGCVRSRCFHTYSQHAVHTVHVVCFVHWHRVV